MTNIFRNGSGKMAEYVVNLSGNICELFIILFFLKDSYKPRVKKPAFIPLCIVFTLFQFVNNNLFLGKSYLVMLGCIIFAFLVLMLYEMRMLQRIVYTVLIYIIFAFSELILATALSLGFNIGVPDIHKNILLFAIATLTSKFLSYVFGLVFKMKRLMFEDESIKRNVLWFFLLPAASVLILLLLLRCCYQIEDTSFNVITLIASVILAFANIAIFYVIDKQNELIETKEKLLFAELHINNQVLHYQELNKHHTELKIFRHDIKNRLVSLMAMIKEGETDKAIQIMENNLDWLDEANSNIVNSGNPIIDAILQSKLHTAKEKEVTLQISTKLAEEITVDELELGIVLGNALDNAIEAAEKVPNKGKRYVRLSLMSTEDRISVSIENPVAENIDTENLKTTKSDKGKHGYGIKSIKTIVQKYDGFANFTCENSIFTTNINMANINLKR